MVSSEQLVTDAMMATFNDKDEPIMFQAKVIKLSRYNIEQRRILVLTGDHIYLFEKQKLNRRHRVTNMAAIIESTIEEEVVLSFPNAKDLRMRGMNRD